MLLSQQHGPLHRCQGQSGFASQLTTDFLAGKRAHLSIAPFAVGGGEEVGGDVYSPAVGCFTREQLEYWEATTADPWVVSTLSKASSSNTDCQGFKGEFWEKLPNPQPADCVHWNQAGLSDDEGNPISEASRRDSPPHSTIQERQGSDTQILSGAAGHAYSSFLRNTPGPPFIEASPNMDEQVRVASKTSQGQAGNGYHQFPKRVTAMEEAVIPYCRVSARVHSFSQRSGNDRRIPGRMGSRVAVQDCPRHIGPTAGGTTQKCVGATGSHSCPQAFPASPSRETRPYKDGQHVSGLPYKPPGEYKVSSIPEADSAATFMGLPSVLEPEGNAHSRHTECHGGLLVQTTPQSRGMEAGQGNGAGHLAPIWQSRGGSFSLSSHDTLPPLVLTQGVNKPLGPGCTGTRVAPPAPLCIPPTPAHATHLLLDRICQEGHRVLLVAPRWPGRIWFPVLYSLLDGQPWCLPGRTDLLSQQGGQIWHPNPARLQLWVWPLKGLSHC